MSARPPMPGRPAVPHAARRALPWLVFLGALGAYAATLCPTVAGGDAGELITAAATGGVPHPPGYPLYALLGRLFAALPAGSVAARINLLSAACAAGAAALLFLAVRAWRGSDLGGLVAAGAFAFAPLTWRYAVTAEVFALNDLLVAAMLWLAARFAGRRDAAGVVAFAGVAGLALSNHHTSILVSAPLGVWHLWAARAALREGGAGPAARRLLAVAGAGALGLLPYAWLPAAAAADRPMSWGAPDTWAGFLDHVLRREYGTFRLAAQGTGGGDLVEGIGRFLAALPAELTVPGAALGAAGLLVALRREGPGGLGAALAAALAVDLLVFEGLANLPPGNPLSATVHARFWLQPALLVAAFAGVGAAAAWEALAARWRGATAGPALALGAACFLGHAALEWRAADQRGNRVAEAYGRALLASLPEGALLFSYGDLAYGVLGYLQQVEGLRPDVRVIDRPRLATAWYPAAVARRMPGLGWPAAGGDAVSLALASAHRRPTFWTEEEGAPATPFPPPAHAVPWGLTSRLLPGRPAPGDVAAWSAAEAALAAVPFPPPDAFPPGTWERAITLTAWDGRLAFARSLLTGAVAESGPHRREALVAAARALQRLVEEHPAPPAEAWTQLAFAYLQLGLPAEAAAAQRRVFPVP